MGTRRMGLRFCPGTWTGPESYPTHQNERPAGPFYWSSGLLVRTELPECPRAIGSVVTYPVFWGNSLSEAGATQDRMCRNPTSLRVPESLGRWRSDCAPPLEVAVTAGWLIAFFIS